MASLKLGLFFEAPVPNRGVPPWRVIVCKQFDPPHFACVSSRLTAYYHPRRVLSIGAAATVAATADAHPRSMAAAAATATATATALSRSIALSIYRWRHHFRVLSPYIATTCTTTGIRPLLLHQLAIFCKANSRRRGIKR